VGVVALRIFGKVVCKSRDDMTDAAAWVGDITEVARDQVDVQVGDGLSAGLADIDTDIEAVWGMVRFDELFADLESLGERMLFFGGCIEPCGNVSMGDEEQVSGAYGKRVPQSVHDCRSVLVHEEDALGIDIAERARHGARRVYRVERYCFVNKGL
jgi:hypothetical protein